MSSQEKSAAYKQMMELWAWKDFWTKVQAIKGGTQESFANASDLSLFECGSLNGQLKAIEAITYEVNDAVRANGN